MSNDAFHDNDTITFERLALALAADYESVYVINNKDDSYVEYKGSGNDNLDIISSGSDFYADTIINCRKLVYPNDQAMFLKTFTKDNVYAALNTGKSFSLNYRLVINGQPKYYFLKTIRGTGADSDFIIIGVQNVDEQVRRATADAVEKATYHHIANALASRYEVIYYINAKTNEYVQYSASEEYARLGTMNKGTDFFVDCVSDIRKYIHPDDAEWLITELDKDKLIYNLSLTGYISLTYRQFFGNTAEYVNMQVVSPKNDPGIIVMGVTNIDAQIKRERSIEEKSRSYAEVIRALAGRYEVIYRVDLVTDEYLEYSSSSKYAQIHIGHSGNDFFGDTHRNMKTQIYEEDYSMMAHAMEKEVFLAGLKETGTYTLNYRLMLDGRPQYVTLFAVQPKEDPSHVVIAVSNVDADIRREMEYKQAIGSAMDMAVKDALTGVKNKYAYVQAEAALDSDIAEGKVQDFAIMVADVNGLKNINDTLGHNAGDEYIRNACHLVCTVFKHSPVFRVGGDEFAVSLKGQDLEARKELMAVLENEVSSNREKGLVTISVGIAEYEHGSDIRVQDVFERADKYMYAQKKMFK